MSGAPPRKLAEFQLVPAGSAPAPLAAGGGEAALRVVSRRREATLKGRLAQGPFLLAFPSALLYLLLIATGELAMLYLGAVVGIAVHAAVFLLLLSHAGLLRGHDPSLSRLLIALAPVPLVRIVSVTAPLEAFAYIHWFTVLSVVLYGAILAAVKLLKADLRAIGLRMPAMKHVPLELGIIAAGFLFGVIEYQLLRPGILVSDLTLRSLAAPVLILFVATGLLEELLFRGLLQKYAGDALGPWAGIALATALFGVLHAGWNSWLDMLFVAGVGAIYAMTVKRTGSIVGVSVSHCVTNVMLFLVMPVLAAGG